MISRATGPLISVEGNVLEVIIHREETAPDEYGVPPLYESGALIDTGASDVCIDFRIAHALRLRQIDQRTILTAGGPIQVPVYLGLFEVPVLHFKKLMRLFAPRIDRINYNVLIGRSLLRDFVYTYDGPADMSHFARPMAHGDHEELDG